ncbi:MAG TPA: hypothetical protein VFT82_00615 [Candidatus Paceibacterota bacterium]|nr:hypothetical protein [Candidatus Paceibacterota bacterium]
MNYTLSVFDKDYAQVHLNLNVNSGKMQQFDLSDLADQDLDPLVRFILSIPGVCSVIMCGNALGIELYEYCGLSWTLISHKIAMHAADMFSDTTLVHRVSNEDFKDLFPFSFSEKKLSLGTP